MSCNWLIWVDFPFLPPFLVFRRVHEETQFDHQWPFHPTSLGKNMLVVQLSPPLFSGYTTGSAVKRRLLVLSPNNSGSPLSVRKFRGPSKVDSSGNFVSGEIVCRVRNGRNPRKTGLVVKSGSGLKSEDDEQGSGVVKVESLVENPSGLWLNSGNLAGFESILDRVSKRLVFAIFWAVIFARRDTEAMWAILGNFLNLWFSTFLKYMLKQERPVPGLRLDPGMPSSHAQTFFFNILFAVMSIVELLGVNWVSLTAGGLAMVLASYLSWLRVSQKFHTISQVAVGALIGSSFFICWFWCWDSFVQAAYFSNLWIRGSVVLAVTGCCATLVTEVLRARLLIKDEHLN